MGTFGCYTLKRVQRQVLESGEKKGDRNGLKETRTGEKDHRQIRNDGGLKGRTKEEKKAGGRTCEKNDKGNGRKEKATERRYEKRKGWKKKNLWGRIANRKKGEKRAGHTRVEPRHDRKKDRAQDSILSEQEANNWGKKGPNRGRGRSTS